jgi:NAD(P)H-dependent flavin oxidoreductase YrpB (nitropropane dioxygenase family)
VHRYGKPAKDVAFNPVGQVVGQMNDVQPVREVIQGMAEEYFDALERMNSLNPED